ncbi:hypothetical protein BDV39DRAFT_112862 [Aspergillus sergii]|uniref:Uncharacterized protein n=1 Tax=Aspergillus sergii TaxID=1034303 RepID=A0A5N6X0F3_9EURO|nr:hypothetical protein BDV39DRAFT_112862 [Aspergillus sergii]
MSRGLTGGEEYRSIYCFIHSLSNPCTNCCTSYRRLRPHFTCWYWLFQMGGWFSEEFLSHATSSLRTSRYCWRRLHWNHLLLGIATFGA